MIIDLIRHIRNDDATLQEDYASVQMARTSKIVAFEKKHGKKLMFPRRFVSSQCRRWTKHRLRGVTRAVNAANEKIFGKESVEVHNVIYEDQPLEVMA